MGCYYVINFLSLTIYQTRKFQTSLFHILLGFFLRYANRVYVLIINVIDCKYLKLITDIFPINFAIKKKERETNVFLEVEML